MGCHFLLQGVLPTPGSNAHLLLWRVGCLPPSPAGKHPIWPHRPLGSIIPDIPPREGISIRPLLSPSPEHPLLQPTAGYRCPGCPHSRPDQHGAQLAVPHAPSTAPPPPHRPGWDPLPSMPVTHSPHPHTHPTLGSAEKGQAQLRVPGAVTPRPMILRAVQGRSEGRAPRPGLKSLLYPSQLGGLIRASECPQT